MYDILQLNVDTIQSEYEQRQYFFNHKCSNQSGGVWDFAIPLTHSQSIVALKKNMPLQIYGMDGHFPSL